MATHTIPRKQLPTTLAPAALPVPEKPSNPHPPSTVPTNAPDASWDIPSDTAPQKKRTAHGSNIQALRERIDRLLPPYKRYLGWSRRTFLCVLCALLVVLVALVVGLVVGLTRRAKGPQNLPLPTTNGPYTGDLTYYAPSLGACGIKSSDNDAIVAISHYTFDAAQTGTDPNQNPLCGRRLRARVGERSLDVRVVDRCTGCQPTDIDVSPSAFAQLADPTRGRVPVTWAWL